ncbi:MAG: hypothetical protein OHK0047_02690 [Leptolyngbyaceae cyanobacterium]
MNNSYIETPPEYTATPYQLNEYHPAIRVIGKARKARARRVNAESMVVGQTYSLDPFQQQMILENERYRRQLMLQRDREDSRRRRLLEQQAYSTMGSIGSTAGREFVKSLF